jgi:HCOMODA/2-hydroxy-3-carboxy-muconic semialdehyde decarboxylase
MVDLIVANRVLASEGLVDAFGHVSVRHNRDANRYLLSRSLAPALVTAGDIIEYDLDSNPVNAEGRAQYSERFIHGEIYRARPDVQAIVHNHSPSVVLFSVSSVKLRPVYHMAAFIGDGLPSFDIREAAGMTEMLVNNSDRGRSLARSLGSGPAVLMRGHGVAVVGPSLPFAVGRSYYLEMNAGIQAQAMSLGGQVTYLDPEEARKVLEAGENRSYDRSWELWKKQVLEAR